MVKWLRDNFRLKVFHINLVNAPRCENWRDLKMCFHVGGIPSTFLLLKFFSRDCRRNNGLLIKTYKSWKLYDWYSLENSSWNLLQRKLFHLHLTFLITLASLVSLTNMPKDFSWKTKFLFGGVFPTKMLLAVKTCLYIRHLLC